MTKTKKLLSVLLSLVMMLSITAGLDFSAYAASNLTTGKCGKNVSYSFNSSTGTLTISGKGEMKDYSCFEGEGSPFFECKNVKKVNVKEGITSIGSAAFFFVDLSKADIILPKTIKKINAYAFALTYIESISLPDSLENIGYGAFCDNPSLKSIKIPKSVKKIDSCAFFYTGLKSIKFEEGLTSIGALAFNNCEIATVELPKSLTTLGWGVFDDATKNIRFLNPNCKISTKSVNGSCAHGVPISASSSLPENAKIYGYKNSTAQAYAKKYGNKFVALTNASKYSVKLSASIYTYNGKVRKPTVTVKDTKGKKIASSNYTVTYSSGRKNVGKYTVTIKFKGNYSGTVKKTFTIKPKATSISKLTAKSKGFTVKWKKQSTQTTGYQIQYSTSSKFKSAKTVTVSKNKTTSKTISKLKAKKKYYVRVRTYKTVKVNGKNTKIYSGWSKAKAVTTKK